MSLDKYKMPKEVSEGIKLHLDDAEEVSFMVRLPTTYNKAYRQAMLGNLDIDAQGKILNPLNEVHEANKSAFLGTCIVSGKIGRKHIDDLNQFFQEYPLAGDELYRKANDAAKKLKDDGADMEKPKLVSTG